MALKLVTGAGLAPAAGVGGPAYGLVQGSRASSRLKSDQAMRWAKGLEGQRKADLGDGRFLNPIVSGDHPDPTILKDGADYYMTFSTFDSYPGLVIWHSRDLVNWRPVTAALTRNIGSVWAPELVRHKGPLFPLRPGEGLPEHDPT
jgi:xylan 1,4-beta-xylosidase